MKANSRGEIIGLLLFKNGSSEIQNEIRVFLQKIARENILPYLSIQIHSEIEMKYIITLVSSAILGVLQEWITSGKFEIFEEEILFRTDSKRCTRSINLSTNTIYNWIYSGLIKFPIKNLRLKGKRYQRKYSGRILKKTPSPQFYENRLVTDRAEATILRTNFGHWEADTVVSKQGVAACLATFIERKTRHYVAIKIPNKTGRSIMAAIKRLVEMYPNSVKSITCERGSEFVNQFEIGLIEDTFDCKIYYANPCAPHERGSNENHNGLLREYFPKPSNFKNISQNKINQAVQSMNLRPRKLFKWKSPQHKFNLEYSKAF